MFVDKAKIYISSGKGGNGSASFRRERFIEFGGPDGGDGGRGGDIWIKAVNMPLTLMDFRYAQHYRAGNGANGRSRKRTGADGEDVILKVPPGTVVFDEHGENIIATLDKVGQQVMLIKGGNGGFGNTRFKSSTNQAPKHANPGQAGQELWIRLRLKLVADIGLIGLPNAGKSTLLAAITAAKPKIGNYPFTTLKPNLGVVAGNINAGDISGDDISGDDIKTASDDNPDSASINGKLVIADIPGLIAGASTGIGLGTHFLGHIESCAVLLHLIDCTSQDVIADYCVVRQEMTAYGSGVETKPEIIVLTKSDLIKAEVLATKQKLLADYSDKKVMAVSAMSKQGLERILSVSSAMIEPRHYDQINDQDKSADNEVGLSDDAPGWQP